MRTILISILAILFSFSLTLAEEYIIRPTVPDFTPGDGFLDAGSQFNPYVIETQSGEEIGTIQSEVPDFTPGDGFMDSGSFENPWILTTPD